MGEPKTGHGLHLYYNSATHASPTWVEVVQVEDVMIDQWDLDTAELLRRATRWVMEIPTTERLTGSFKLWHGMGATVFTALRTRRMARTPTEFFFANGLAATSGTEGLRAYMLMKSFPWSQSLKECSSHDIKVGLTYYEESGSEVLPDWMVVT